jgi:phosphohistidine swiveling domain-containing protein
VKPQLIILGAGAPREEGRPFGLQKVTLRGRVLDWQLDAFSALAPEVCFVGGYDIHAVMQQFPRLTYHFNADWQETGPVASLALALESLDDLAEGRRDLYIAYADILLRPALVRALFDSNADACAVAVDDLRRDPALAGHPTETLTLDGCDYEFVGLARVPASFVPAFRKAVLQGAAALRCAHLSRLLAEGAVPLRGVAAQDLWAHAEHGRSVAHFVLGSKAATLARLQHRLERSRILPLAYFTRQQWQTERGEVLERLTRELPQQRALIVRSSATDEDGFQRANAGRYHSELDVGPAVATLGPAIDRVFASYDGHDESDEVLVQPQLDGVKASGVIFTRTLETGAPWRVIHYSHGSDTTEITAGASRGGVKLVVSRFADAQALARLPALGRRLIEAVDEIEQRVCHDALDIEFALDANDQLVTLQVRPLFVSDAHQDRDRDAEVADCLRGLTRVLNDLAPPPAGQVGRETVWSVMADWNPAEIVGVTPGPLALDLYRYLVTDGVWAEQRYQAGYRDLRGWPLMRSFCGQPFVDVRASLNSFLPAGLPEALAARLVDHAIDRLRSDRALHDKIEFELLPTCFDFGFADWHAHYTQNGITDVSEMIQLQDGLRCITRGILAQAEDQLIAARALEARCVDLERVTLPFPDWLRRTLVVCSREGTLVFAHLARAGFVAAALLRSAVRAGLLTEERRAALMESLPGLGLMLTDAAAAVREGRMTRTSFIGRFGHLRPGTYDINTPAYRDRPEAYLDPIIATAHPRAATLFEWTGYERTALDSALAVLKLGVDAEGLLRFVRVAVEGREYSKFVFTRLLSVALDNFAAQGRAAGISADRLTCMPLDFWLTQSVLAWGEEGARAELAERTERRHRGHALTGRILLPPVLAHADEVYAFAVPQSEPNFITQRRARAPLRVIAPGAAVSREAVAGCVVAISNADPGFDFLFALDIRGLVTAFGGPNSHMAIRASEFAIPAVIGIGEQAFTQLRDGAIIELDGQQRLWRQENWKCVP